MPCTTSEADLLRSQSPAYIESLVRECGPWMLGLATRILGDAGEAEDAVQEAFLSAFKAAPRFEGQSKVATWLHRIVVNAALMRLRSKKRRLVADERGVDDLAAPRSTTAPAHGHSTSDPTLRAVRVAVEGLPEAYRLPILLCDVEEMKAEEVATLTGLTVGALKSRLHRGRVMLREKLLPLLGEVGSSRQTSSMGGS